MILFCHVELKELISSSQNVFPNSLLTILGKSDYSSIYSSHSLLHFVNSFYATFVLTPFKIHIAVTCATIWCTLLIIPNRRQCVSPKHFFPSTICFITQRTTVLVLINKYISIIHPHPPPPQPPTGMLNALFLFGLRN
jgi:hypothetical protein